MEKKSNGMKLNLKPKRSWGSAFAKNEKEGNEKIFLFHTVSIYPTLPEEVNLNAIKTLQQEFPQIPVGFSDHSIGPVASIAAATLGARLIERHFTYDRNAEGPDHILSSECEEMKLIVDTIRTIETMRGNGVKEPIGVEIQNRINNRKSIVAIKSIKKDEEFSVENIDIKRPGTGIKPKHFEIIIGKIAKKDIESDYIINWEDFE